MPSEGLETSAEVEASRNGNALKQQSLLTHGQSPGALQIVQRQEVIVKVFVAMMTLLGECRSKGTP